MYASIAILPDLDDKVLAHFEGDIPVIRFDSHGSGSQCIHVVTGNPDEQASWLRSLAAKLLILSDDIEERAADAGTALAEQHIADAKAAAGIGGGL